MACGLPRSMAREGQLMQVSLTLLRRLKKHIANGQGVWAVLMANEYLEPSNPLHKAILQLAFPRPARTKLGQRLQQLISAGATLRELPLGLQRIALRPGSPPSAKSVSDSAPIPCPILLPARILRRTVPRRTAPKPQFIHPNGIRSISHSSTSAKPSSRRSTNNLS